VLVCTRVDEPSVLGLLQTTRLGVLPGAVLDRRVEVAAVAAGAGRGIEDTAGVLQAVLDVCTVSTFKCNFPGLTRLPWATDDRVATVPLAAAECAEVRPETGLGTSFAGDFFNILLGDLVVPGCCVIV
jgi:hypothetical protein